MVNPYIFFAIKRTVQSCNQPCGLRDLVAMQNLHDTSPTPPDYPHNIFSKTPSGDYQSMSRKNLGLLGFCCNRCPAPRVLSIDDNLFHCRPQVSRLPRKVYAAGGPPLAYGAAPSSKIALPAMPSLQARPTTAVGRHPTNKQWTTI